MPCEPDSPFLLVNELEVAGPWSVLVLIASKECSGGLEPGSLENDYCCNSDVVKGDDRVAAASAGSWFQAAD